MAKVLGVLMALAVCVEAQAQSKWAHLRIVENKHGGARVAVNLPASAAHAAARAIRLDSRARVEIDGVRVSTESLRNAWQELREAPPGTSVNINDRDGTLEMSATAHGLQIRCIDRWTTEETRIHIRRDLADVLSQGVERVDTAALFSALGRNGGSPFVAISDDDTRVEIWVDQNPEGDVR